MAPQKLSDANLESTYLVEQSTYQITKEVGQLTEGALQELFQKLLKAEFSRGSTTHEFRQMPSHRAPAQNTNGIPVQENNQKEDNRTRLQNIKCHRCGRKGHVAISLVVLLLIKFV